MSKRISVPNPRRCQWCNNPFTKGTANKKYCSKRCVGFDYRKNKHPYIKKIKSSRPCVICKIFFIYSGTKSNQRCCSLSCQSKKYRREHPEWYQKILRDHRPYMTAWYKQHRAEQRAKAKERRNQKYFGGNQFKALKRDRNHCRNCNYDGQLVIHHKDKSGNTLNPNNNLGNLITLCRSCHARIHPNPYLRGRLKLNK